MRKHLQRVYTLTLDLLMLVLMLAAPVSPEAPEGTPAEEHDSPEGTPA